MNWSGVWVICKFRIHFHDNDLIRVVSTTADMIKKNRMVRVPICKAMRIIIFIWHYVPAIFGFGNTQLTIAQSVNKLSWFEMAITYMSHIHHYVDLFSLLIIVILFCIIYAFKNSSVVNRWLFSFRFLFLFRKMFYSEIFNEKTKNIFKKCILMTF